MQNTNVLISQLQTLIANERNKDKKALLKKCIETLQEPIADQQPINLANIVEIAAELNSNPELKKQPQDVRPLWVWLKVLQQGDGYGELHSGYYRFAKEYVSNGKRMIKLQQTFFDVDLPESTYGTNWLLFLHEPANYTT